MVSRALAITFAFQAGEGGEEEALPTFPRGGRVPSSFAFWLRLCLVYSLPFFFSMSDCFLVRKNIQDFTYFTREFAGQFMFCLNKAITLSSSENWKYQIRKLEKGVVRGWHVEALSFENFM